MSGQSLRCEGDEGLQERLKSEPVVESVRRKIEEMPEKGVRRQLLATSLRLTRTMSPRLHDMLDHCRQVLGVTIPLEAYVYNSPQFNAACIKPEDGTLLLMFSSSLLEKFDSDELSFVMGHELGHHLFGHHDIPVGYLVGGENRVNARLALQLFAWSRFAEVSADRAGAVCTSTGDAAARALFKLASGLTTDLIEIRIDEFAAQVDEMDLETPTGKQAEPQADWFMTHPFTPLRVKALQAFYQSELVAEKGISREELETRCNDLMGLMSPNYLDEKSEVAETMRRVLFAAGLGLIRCSGGVKQEEVDAFDSLFGPGSFSEDLDFETLENLLESRIEEANRIVPQSRKIQIVRDLCLLAVADGRVAPRERRYVYEIGRKLKVPREVVDASFENETTLD